MHNSRHHSESDPVSSILPAVWAVEEHPGEHEPKWLHVASFLKKLLQSKAQRSKPASMCYKN